MVCQSRFILSKTCTILVCDVIMGEAMHVWGQEEYGKSLISLQFCCKPKSLKTKTVFKKEWKYHWWYGPILILYLSLGRNSISLRPVSLKFSTSYGLLMRNKREWLIGRNTSVCPIKITQFAWYLNKYFNVFSLFT